MENFLPWYFYFYAFERSLQWDLYFQPDSWSPNSSLDNHIDSVICHLCHRQHMTRMTDDKSILWYRRYGFILAHYSLTQLNVELGCQNKVTPINARAMTPLGMSKSTLNYVYFTWHMNTWILPLLPKLLLFLSAVTGPLTPSVWAKILSPKVN